jgi:DNA-binding MarR family transcriptional regulator
LSITMGAASQAVDQLERRGYCVRTANAADRGARTAVSGAGAAMAVVGGLVTLLVQFRRRHHR